MRINLSKKNKIIAIATLAVVLAGSGGYLLWRVNQNSSLSSQNSNAANCAAHCGTAADHSAYTSRDAGKYGTVNCNDNEAGYQQNNDGELWCCTPYYLVCTSTCGDGTCDSGETSSSCPSDCVCSAFTWTNKPSGSYNSSQATSPINDITVTNPNSTSTSTTGIVIKLNNTAITSQCEAGGNCYTVSTNSNGKQVVTISLFRGLLVKAPGSYTLSVSLPGNSSACTTNTTETTSFTVTSTNQCSAFTWSNKPSGTYTTTTVPNPVVITNPNSTSTSSTGVTVQLNTNSIPACSTSTGTSGVTGTLTGVPCYALSTNSSGNQVISIDMEGHRTDISGMNAGSYTLSVTLPGSTSSCTESTTETTTFTVAQPDTTCTALIWTNKPSGTYKTTATIPAITIINKNSPSAATTGVTLKLNGTTIAACTSTVTTGNCYDISTNTSGYQQIVVRLFRGAAALTEGTYTLLATLPGTSASCANSISESVTFTVSNGTVPNTGLLSDSVVKISLGVGFVFLGVLATQFSKLDYMFSTLGERTKNIIDKKRRKKLEDRFK